jgi:hypothetical protein
MWWAYSPKWEYSIRVEEGHHHGSDAELFSVQRILNQQPHMEKRLDEDYMGFNQLRNLGTLFEEFSSFAEAVECAEGWNANRYNDLDDELTEWMSG